MAQQQDTAAPHRHPARPLRSIERPPRPRNVLQTDRQPPQGATTVHDRYVWDLRYTCLPDRRRGGRQACRPKSAVGGRRRVESPILRWCDYNPPSRPTPLRRAGANGDFADPPSWCRAGLRWAGANEVLYYTNDAQYNVTALVNTAGKVVERYRYDPYGQVTFLNGEADKDGAVAEWSVDTAQGALANDWSNELLYCGYRLDPTGLYHVRHRMYHPTLGRWMHRDPAGYVDGMSLYEYAASSATGNVDSSGRRPQTPPPQTSVPHTSLKPTGTGGTTYGWNGVPAGRVDLAGGAHGGVPTPHTQLQSINVRPTDGKAFANGCCKTVPGTPGTSARAAQAMGNNIARTAPSSGASGAGSQLADDAARAAASAGRSVARGATSAADDVARGAVGAASRSPGISVGAMFAALDITATMLGDSEIPETYGIDGRWGEECIYCVCRQAEYEHWDPKWYNLNAGFTKELRERVLFAESMTRKDCYAYQQAFRSSLEEPQSREHDIWWTVTAFQGVRCTWKVPPQSSK